MKKLLLFAAAALGMATAQTITPAVAERVAEQVGADVVVAKEGTSWPVSPKSDSAQAEHQVVFAPRQMRPVSYGYVPHYSDQARPRRVRYGKSRWIVLS